MKRNPDKIKEDKKQKEAKCTHKNTYYCMKTGGGRCRDCGYMGG